MTLFETILQQYGTNEPILSSEISFQDYSRPWIYKQLNRLCEEGKLVRYVSSNKAVATVSKNGVIKAKKAGNCTIYAVLSSGKYVPVKVTVK